MEEPSWKCMRNEWKRSWEVQTQTIWRRKVAVFQMACLVRFLSKTPFLFFFQLYESHTCGWFVKWTEFSRNKWGVVLGVLSSSPAPPCPPYCPLTIIWGDLEISSLFSLALSILQWWFLRRTRCQCLYGVSITLITKYPKFSTLISSSSQDLKGCLNFWEFRKC